MAAHFPDMGFPQALSPTYWVFTINVALPGENRHYLSTSEIVAVSRHFLFL